MVVSRRKVVDEYISVDDVVKNGKINYDVLSRCMDSNIYESVGSRVLDNLFPKRNEDFYVKIGVEPEIRDGERLVRRTLSICPECRGLVRAVVLERDGKIWLRKVCPDHGSQEEIYWGDAEFYFKKRKEAGEGRGIENPYVEISNVCPFNCGLCARHRSHTALLNLAVTNRCHLGCWYCFFYAEAAGYVYEPSLSHIKFMLAAARKQRPIPATAVQITGGEPTVRDDLVEIVKIAKELGYKHVQVNTTGITFMDRPELAGRLREAGVNTIYMSFDGVTPISNPKNHWEVPYILDVLREVKMGVVLVPTVIRNVNLDEVGVMVRFGLKHNDVVRGVNFQPISLVGRVPRREREKLRVTIPDVIREIENQTDGEIGMDDWYSVPFTIPISRFVEAITGRQQFTMTNHFACGTATYVIQDRRTGKITPVTRFIRVVELMEYLDELTDYILKGGIKKLALIKLTLRLGRFIDWENTPEHLRKRKRILRILFKIFARHDYRALGEFHYNSLFLGMMHFMDEYNYDVARVERCDIHYVTPDGRVVPFCTFNVFPELYRDRVQKSYSIPLKDYLKKVNLRSITYERYRRNIKKLEAGEIYRKIYDGFWDPRTLSYEEKKKISLKFGIPVVED
jgi:hypothetical protein